MNKADLLFLEQVREILGQTTEQKTRAKWADGTNSKTKAIFAAVTKFDLAKEFPIITFKKQYWKSAIKEVFWIHQKYSNNINELGLKIWDQWADENGSIKKAYGYQTGKKYKWEDVPHECTQIERVLYLLKKDPSSRRMRITMINNEEVTEKALEECAHTVEFTVLNNKLNMILNQRSGDHCIAAGAGGWNEIQYAALQIAIAHCSDLEIGEFAHVTTNLHIYDKHVETVKELVKLKPSEKIPILKIKAEAPKNFFELTEKDFELLNYEPQMEIKNLEVAG